MKRVTIKDVAKEAGVSITTVSHALSGKGILSRETRAYVQNIARQMNYVPDLYGSNLKKKKTGNIGLIISAVKGDYYSMLINSMAQECQKNGYDLNVIISAQHEKMMANILGGSLDGAVILSQEITDEDARQIEEMEFPAVFLDKKVSGKYTSSVIFDAFVEGRTAGEYLIGLGHRRMAYLQGVEKNYDSIWRRAGFESALTEAGISLDEEDVIPGEFDRDITYEHVIDYMEREDFVLPDAFFASNDLSALGCINALHAKGYRVPGDVSVMGCDDIEQSGWYRQRLTTIHTNYEKQGIIAVKKLMGMIHNKEEGEICELESYLVVRNSCMENHKYDDR